MLSIINVLNYIPLLLINQVGGTVIITAQCCNEQTHAHVKSGQLST